MKFTQAQSARESPARSPTAPVMKSICQMDRTREATGAGDRRRKVEARAAEKKETPTTAPSAPPMTRPKKGRPARTSARPRRDGCVRVCARRAAEWKSCIRCDLLMELIRRMIIRFCPVHAMCGHRTLRPSAAQFRFHISLRGFFALPRINARK